MRENIIQQRVSKSFKDDCSPFKDTLRRPLIKSQIRFTLIVLFFAAFFAGAFLTTRLSPEFYSSLGIPKTPQVKVEIPLNCSAHGRLQTCPNNYPANLGLEEILSPTVSPTCPDYFRWIHEDLRPWAQTGISRDMIERAKPTANFRLVIVNGKAYMKRYRKSFQSRDTFTLWGVLQLLRRYPGQLPDLDIMFDCADPPVILSKLYVGPHAQTPPPLFRYSGDDSTSDIVFPDWSFWGWPEINIKSWEPLLNDLMEGNKKKGWVSRQPFAYWKGNPRVAPTRQDLLKCNISKTHDWNARIYTQDWSRDSRGGFKESNLASQCIHRYKIYIEGAAWSVSQKYILACDSMTLLVMPRYYDFFTRSLVPMQHYWPIKNDDKCESIKFAVDWGNSEQHKAQEIGKKASRFIREELKMEFVYDYMFHLLSEYSRLLTFDPTIPKNATELCPEAMACKTGGLTRKFMEESLVKNPSDKFPCTMPPPYDPSSLRNVISTRENSIKKVEEMKKLSRENKRKPPYNFNLYSNSDHTSSWGKSVRVITGKLSYIFSATKQIRNPNFL